MEDYITELKNNLQGDIVNDTETLERLSHDASLFEVKPQLVIFPKNQSDVEKLVKITTKFKKSIPNLSITARSAGTDMSGGPLNDSVVVDFSRYFNVTPTIKDDAAITQPGVFYRDFEKVTLSKGLLFPSYPASKTICAMGGIVNNNSGGERSLRYGKTEKYVQEMTVVLADGNTYKIKPLNKNELDKKIKQEDFEGEVYKRMKKLIDKNGLLIEKAEPGVAKNSAGYNLWKVINDDGNFDLSKLFVGAQGTLGLMTEAKIKLVPIEKHSRLVVIYLPDLSRLTEVAKLVLPLNPESFESYDDNTLKLALRYFPEFFKQFGIVGMLKAAMAFFPAFVQMIFGKMPKLILQVGFSGNSESELISKTNELEKLLAPLKLKVQTAIGDEMDKYWLVRRESFNLLRKKIRNKHTAPFIDDFVVTLDKIEEVLPKIIRIIESHKEYVFTVAGHIGEGNFHIIPIVDIKNPKVRESIPVIAEQVYRIVVDSGGSITGEHNDGLIRTPFLEMMYGKKVIKLFEEVKDIFDLVGIFNPRKKTKGDLDYAMEHLRENW